MGLFPACSLAPLETEHTFSQLLYLIQSWGWCPAPGRCPVQAFRKSVNGARGAQQGYQAPCGTKCPPTPSSRLDNSSFVWPYGPMTSKFCRQLCSNTPYAFYMKQQNVYIFWEKKTTFGLPITIFIQKFCGFFCDYLLTAHESDMKTLDVIRRCLHPLGRLRELLQWPEEHPFYIWQIISKLWARDVKKYLKDLSCNTMSPSWKVWVDAKSK